MIQTMNDLYYFIIIMFFILIQIIYEYKRKNILWYQLIFNKTNSQFEIIDLFISLL